MKKTEYQKEICPCCSQSTTYLLAIDNGTVNIVRQMARFIKKKGINAVHPRKEMEGEYLSSNEVGNLSRPRFHGLIAKLEGEAGNYVLTNKGLAFLRGKPIPRHAIVSKVEGRNIGYFNEEETVVIQDFPSDSTYWEGNDFEISGGRVIAP